MASPRVEPPDAVVPARRGEPGPWPLRVFSHLDGFLIAIVVAVGAASLLPVRGATATAAAVLAQLAVALLFFLHGARLSTRDALEGLRHWRLHLMVFAATFALFPLLGLASQVLQPALLPPSLYVGVLFMCLLPSAVQSSIAFTSIAGGNVAAAVCAVSLSNLAGVVVTPLLAALLLGSVVEVSLDSALRIGGQLLLPFLLGQAAAPRLGRWLEGRQRILGLVDRGSVLLVIYTAFSAGIVAGVWRGVTPAQVLWLLAVDATILALVLTSTGYIAGRLGFSPPNRIVIIFCGSMKSIATGIPMAAVLFAHRDIGLIVLPAMLLHQMQLVICAVLARRRPR